MTNDKPITQHPPYRIVTARLHLRCWELTDAPALKQTIDRNREHLAPWMIWIADEPQSVRQKVERLRLFRGEFDLGRSFVYGIFDSDGELLGCAALIPRVGPGGIEIGYWMDAAHGGKGFATEAAGALTRVAFDIFEVQRVQIHCHPDNLASMRVAEKLGYVREATLTRRYPWHDGEFQDQTIWTLFKEGFPGSPAAEVELRAFDALDTPM